MSFKLVSFLHLWLIVSVAVYYLSIATYFCVKRLKIAISEDICEKRPVRSRSSKVIDFGTNGKRVYTLGLILVINSNFSPILHNFGHMAA